MYRVGTIFVFICGWSLILAAVPSYISVCHRNDPKLSACVKNSIEQLRPNLREGIKELNVPAMEPMHIDDIMISRGSGQYSFRLNLTDVEVDGASNFQLNRLKLDIPNHIYKIGVTFPILHFKGNYAVDTRILSLPINSYGKFNADATNAVGIGILKGSLVTDTFEHLQFSDLSINLKIEDYSLQLEDTGTQDKTIFETINELVNSNKDSLIRMSTPFIENKASELLLNIANNIVNSTPYDEIFPK